MGVISSCGLLFQYLEIKAEADSEQLVRQIYDGCNRLTRCELKAGANLIQYAMTREQYLLDAYESVSREMDEICLELDSLSAPFPSLHNQVVKIVSTRRDLENAATTTRISGDTAELAPLEAYQLRQTVQEKFDQQAKASADLGKTCRKLLSSSKGEASKNWFTIVITTIASILVTTCASFTVSVLITRKIIGRLVLLADNSRRLAKGQPLSPPLDGNDEIAEVDKSFHEMAEALTAAQEKERIVTERLPAGLLILDRYGMILRANSKASELLDEDASTLNGKSITEFLESKQKVTERSFQPLVARSQGKLIELSMSTKTGKDLIVELSLDKIETKSDLTYLAVLLDVTERYQAQALREKFVAMIAHDIRAPLCGIDLTLQAILDGIFGPVTEKLTRKVEKSRDSAQRIVRLLNEMLRLARQQATRIELDMKEIEPTGIVDDAVDSASGAATERGIIIERSAERESTTRIFADRDKLVQVTLNLLTNAVKFSPDKGKITVSESVSNGRFRISIKDQGPGIPTGMDRDIFMPFKQTSWKDSAEKGGTGLGLSICKTIIEDHGGEIGVTSELNHGAIFWFTVPLSTS